MMIMTAVRAATAITVVLLLSGCAQRGTGTPDPTAAPAPTAQLPAGDGALVLRVEHTGGFVTPDMLAGRLPVVSVYADGRVISDGPVTAIYPGPALPNVQVQRIAAADVQELADSALAAGVAETSDLGMLPIADATTTRFTLVTADGTHVRDAYALQEGVSREPSYAVPDRPLTDEQYAARDRLLDLLDELTAIPADGAPSVETYVPEALAAVVRPWTDPADDLAHPERPWPGPALPGESLGGLPDMTCVVAAGEQAPAVLDAARDANTLTPWVAVDGTRWSVTFRPLLPDETGCADLLAD
jgi:hypothetical protein